MTAPDLAATLLKDVKRHGGWHALDPVPVMYETEVLAALTAALDPAIAEQAGEVVKRLTDEHVAASRTEAADLITTLLAQNAALRAEVRKSAMDAVSAGCQAQEAWEAQKAAEARAERLEAALRLLHDNVVLAFPALANLGPVANARAALTTEADNG